MISLIISKEHNLIVIKRLCIQEDCTSPKRPSQLCGPRNGPFNGYRRLFKGIKQPEREDYQSTPFIVQVKKEWSYTSTPHTPPCLALEQFDLSPWPFPVVYSVMSDMWEVTYSCTGRCFDTVRWVQLQGFFLLQNGGWRC